MKQFINYNGRIYEEGQDFLPTTDHSYRYGDGLFETMKLVKGDIMFKNLHFERLYSGLKLLKFNVPALFTNESIENEVKELCKKNNYEESARVRLSVSRGNGGLYDCDNEFSYVLESWPLDQTGINGNGMIIDIFPDAKKSVDVFSNLKSANYLPYVMAAIWAKENKLNDALILNQHDRICDSTIANVFWVKDSKIFTPPLNEGCVAGVMRRKILELAIGNLDTLVREHILTENILLQADEVFLTNAISPIRWVKKCRGKTYKNTISSKIFAALSETI